MNILILFVLVVGYLLVFEGGRRPKSGRDIAYLILRLSNDLRAASSGKMAARIKRRLWGKVSGRVMGKIGGSE